MSVSSWIRFAYFIAAGHNGVVMQELREIAFAIENDDSETQTMNCGMTKERLLNMAREKIRNGAQIPETTEAVDQLGNHVARLEI